MTIYRRMRDTREDADMKQREVAEKLYINRSAYSNYENGTRMVPPEILGRLADLFGTSVDYLMERTDDKSPYPKSGKTGSCVRYVDVTGLTEEEIRHIKDFVDDLRKARGFREE